MESSLRELFFTSAPSVAHPPNVAGEYGPEEDVLLKLEGHGCPVTGLCFHPLWPLLASCAFDGKAFLWDITGPKSSHAVAVLTGHKLSLTAVAFAGIDAEYLVTASADRTAAVHDITTSARVKTFRGHDSHVTSVDARVPERGNGETAVENSSTPDFHCILTASNDRTVRLWDCRSRQAREDIRIPHSYQVLDAKRAPQEPVVFTCGIDPKIRAWDIRKPNEPVLLLLGHTDTVTGLSVSPLGTNLASHGSDRKVCIWDVKPFVGQTGTGCRLEQSLEGCEHSLEQNLMRLGWDRGGTRVVAGSADGTIRVWDADDGELVCHLDGHEGCVNEVRFSHVADTLIASASSDQSILVGHIPRE